MIQTESQLVLLLMLNLICVQLEVEFVFSPSCALFYAVRMIVNTAEIAVQVNAMDILELVFELALLHLSVSAVFAIFAFEVHLGTPSGPHIYALLTVLAPQGLLLTFLTNKFHALRVLL